VNISTFLGAQRAISIVDLALTSVNSARAEMGAIQNRFQSVISNLTTSSENLSASRSRIRDADYARETAELTRTQILQQAGTAMLAQANQIPQNVLTLLRG
ncbi:flagellin, partial [Silanimonas lenta]|uniref:flagellin n=1 Tax=Silanimonas lenta TaxID=265429 RepID=UPI00055EFD0D